MAQRRIGVILNGVTGRMGTNQHLIRSIAAIRADGGVQLESGDRLLPEPVLVGRNRDRLEALAAAHGIRHVSTSLEKVLEDPGWEVYFDAQRTDLRVAAARAAAHAGKAIYCEKPVALTLKDAIDLYQDVTLTGVKTGVVQDKLWLPGLLKLKALIDSDYFGKILSVRGEFGYWVFDGVLQECQRPSWNYRKEDGGGIVEDMFAHWRYVLDNLFGPVRSVSCFATTHIPTRVDESGSEYACSAEDAAYATFLCGDGVVCHFNSSWVVRVRRDDLLTLQVEGTKGTAVAGLRECWIQPEMGTPRPVWNPDVPATIDYHRDWQQVPTNSDYPNAFRAQWELFLRHVAEDAAFPWTLKEGAKGVQLAECALQSSQERRWVDINDLP